MVRARVCRLVSGFESSGGWTTGALSSIGSKGGTVTAPTGAVYGRAEIYFYLTSGWLNVDDVSVTPTTTVNVSETL
jgi:hypothetical protein